VPVYIRSCSGKGGGDSGGETVAAGDACGDGGSDGGSDGGGDCGSRDRRYRRDNSDGREVLRDGGDDGGGDRRGDGEGKLFCECDGTTKQTNSISFM